MTDRLEIDALRTILAIESYGGITRAADKLALSQPAVSHKIKRLEQSLECDLLTRKTGGPLFTEAGLRLLSYARRIIDLQDETFASLRQIKLTGSIRIGMTEDTTSSGIARILGRFSRLYPEVRVHIRIAQSLTLEDQIRDNQLDIAVMQIFSERTRVDDLVLYDDQLCWVKSRELALDTDRPVPFLAFDENCFYRQWAEKQGREYGYDIATVLECPSAAGILAGVRSGLGVALLNRLHVTSELEVLDKGFPEPPAIQYIVRSNQATQTAATSTLVSEISREISNTIPLRVA